MTWELARAIIFAMMFICFFFMAFWIGIKTILALIDTFYSLRRIDQSTFEIKNLLKKKRGLK